MPYTGHRLTMVTFCSKNIQSENFYKILIKNLGCKNIDVNNNLYYFLGRILAYMFFMFFSI